MKISVYSIEEVSPTLHHASMGLTMNLRVDMSERQCELLLIELLEHHGDAKILEWMERANEEDFKKAVAPYASCHYEEGYTEAVKDFGIWKDGVQRIGCLETPIKEVLARKFGKA